MSTYELDDDLVRAFVADSSATDHDKLESARMHQQLQDLLEPQIPIPVPARIGAVVLTNGATDNRLTSGNNYFIRWAYDSATTSPWIEAGNHEEPYRTDAIGRITEVLSPGADL